MAAKPTKSGSRARASSLTPTLTIVVPLFNEAKGLPALHERIAEVARYQQTRRGLNVEVVYVDDGSSDDTGDVARSLPAIPLDIQVVTLSRNFGKEAALMAGLDHAPPGAVLFLDEVGERPYRLDRMLMQLRLSGLLARTSAVVFGELPRCDEPGGAHAARAVVHELLADYPGPVLFGLPSGHTTGPTLTLPFGVRARVVTSPRPVLIIEESAVE